MLISLPSTYIQNFSNWHVLFDFLPIFFYQWFFICSRCGMKWDTVCRPTDDPFWVFLSPGTQEQVHPQTLFVYFRQLKKICIGHSSKKDNHPCLLPQQGFCTSLQIWDQLGVTWQTKQRFFLAISGASNFKHFKQLFMTLSGLGSLTMCELPCWLSYFVSGLL